MSIIKFLILNLFVVWNFGLGIAVVSATTDPLAVPNNKFGIHLISPSVDESSPAAQLVNSKGGDWGYITILIESKDRNHDKWQTFFNDLRRRHLIPLVRLATEPQGNYWKIPYEGEEQAWADFLDRLNWPVKNRYIIIYNEPNQGQEWAGKVDPASYARVLDKTISALKNKNPDFFVLNAGFDASAPPKPPLYQDEVEYLKAIEETVPGIFNKLDGWVSHSYPNPGFVGSPLASGRGTIRTYQWELQLLKSFGVTKKLPVFITETGWKHSEGINYDKSLPSTEKVASYFEHAFQDAWNDPQIVAVTPFLLNYQDYPFDHFSFKRITGEKQNQKILGVSFPEYYPHYERILNMPKLQGQPVQINKAEFTKGSIYPSLVVGESYYFPLTFKNIGQSIWGDGQSLTLKAFPPEKDLIIKTTLPPDFSKVEPGESVTFNVYLEVAQIGTYKPSFQLYQGDQPFDQAVLEFPFQAKSPVILLPKVLLKWKTDPSGDYFLTIKSDITTNSNPVKINRNGEGNPLESKFLLPDYTFQFTIFKPFYKTKTIQQKVTDGINTLDFGVLEPDLFTALLNPKQFWKLLPFENK